MLKIFLIFRKEIIFDFSNPQYVQKYVTLPIWEKFNLLKLKEPRNVEKLEKFSLVIFYEENFFFGKKFFWLFCHIVGAKANNFTFTKRSTDRKENYVWNIINFLKNHRCFNSYFRMYHIPEDFLRNKFSYGKL